MNVDNNESSAPTLTLKDFENLGRAMGQIVAAFRRRYEAGLDDDEDGGEIVTETITDEDEAGSKTQLEDCKACWCNTCAILEKCEKMRDGLMLSDIYPKRNAPARPRPCAGCNDGDRFMPIYEEANGDCQCGEYVQGEENYE